LPVAIQQLEQPLPYHDLGQSWLRDLDEGGISAQNRFLLHRSPNSTDIDPDRLLVLIRQGKYAVIAYKECTIAHRSIVELLRRCAQIIL
jgi:hypothetical protein